MTSATPLGFSAREWSSASPRSLRVGICGSGERWTPGAVTKVFWPPGNVPTSVRIHRSSDPFWPNVGASGKTAMFGSPVRYFRIRAGDLGHLATYEACCEHEEPRRSAGALRVARRDLPGRRVLPGHSVRTLRPDTTRRTGPTGHGTSLTADGSTDHRGLGRADDVALRPGVPHLQLDLHLGPWLSGHPVRTCAGARPWLLLRRGRARRYRRGATDQRTGGRIGSLALRAPRRCGRRRGLQRLEPQQHPGRRRGLHLPQPGRVRRGCGVRAAPVRS